MESPMPSFTFGTPTPCIALRRSCSSPSSPPDQARPRSFDLTSRQRNTSSSSLNKLTGSPGYVTLSGSSSPTKIHPCKPHHVRGGSIGSDISDVSTMDQIIPIQPCDSEMLVPLLHRHLEMKELIANNVARFSRLRHTLGEDLFIKCTTLWTETTRADMNDNEWLRETQRLLKTQDSWVLWCDVVGWDSSSLLLDRTPSVTSERSDPSSIGLDVPSNASHSRRNSTGMPVDTITEEPED